MDQSIRNELRNVVTKCRKLLEEAISQVLQGQFGIYATGKKDEVHIEEESRMKNLSEEDKGQPFQGQLGCICDRFSLRSCNILAVEACRLLTFLRGTFFFGP